MPYEISYIVRGLQSVAVHRELPPLTELMPDIPLQIAQGMKAAKKNTKLKGVTVAAAML